MGKTLEQAWAEGRCPLCHKNWYDGDTCPHSQDEALKRIQEEYIRDIVRDEFKKQVVKMIELERTRATNS